VEQRHSEGGFYETVANPEFEYEHLQIESVSRRRSDFEALLHYGIQFARFAAKINLGLIDRKLL
jgi:hypothetical protein